MKSTKLHVKEEDIENNLGTIKNFSDYITNTKQDLEEEIRENEERKELLRNPAKAPDLDEFIEAYMEDIINSNVLYNRI